MKMTFVIPLKPKRTDFSIRGIFTPEGLSEVAKTYRERGNGPWFPVTLDAPRKPRWFCSQKDCTYWTEGDGSEKGGECSGACFDL